MAARLTGRFEQPGATRHTGMALGCLARWEDEVAAQAIRRRLDLSAYMARFASCHAARTGAPRHPPHMSVPVSADAER